MTSHLTYRKWTATNALLTALLAATVFAIGAFWYVLRDIMPEAVPPEMQKKKRREARKRVREGKKKSN